MPTLGISAFYHDSAAALVGDDGSIIAAAQEERFTRRRHDAAWPSAAINYCMAEGRLAPSDLHGVVFYEIPARKFGRIVDGYRALGASGERIFSETFPDWMTHRGDQADWILAWLKQWDSAIAWENRLFFCEHHVSHAASAFYPSPFRKAAILTVDGVGERATTMMSLGQEGCLTPLRELHYPHSLGLLYSAFTHYTGFKVNSGEYKMMGLAPYGEPIYADRIREELIEIHTDGSFAINTDYVDSFASDRIINTKFEDLFGRPARGSQDPVTRLDVDLAASIQQVTEEAMLALAGAVCAETGAKDLCLAGGVALNCVANGKLVRSGLVDRLWVQPAPGDAGGALGAAYFGHYTRREPPPRSLAATGDSMRGAYLGPGYDDVAVEAALRTHRLKSERLERDAFLDRVAGLLAEGATIGWFQGRMEFGPRALGARSILADPRDSTMQRRLNIQVKQRESFRPFAPVVLEEEANNLFELGQPSPFMGIVAPVRSFQQTDRGADPADFKGRLNGIRSDIPAVTHVDGSARVQTIARDDHPLYYDLIRRFFERTGCPVLINTSFNVRGEPIVCTPDDGIRCFMATDIDYLAIGSFLVAKKDVDPLDALRYVQEFDPD